MYKSLFSLAILVSFGSIALAGEAPYSSNTVLVKYRVGALNTISKLSVNGISVKQYPEIRWEKLQISGYSPKQAIAMLKSDPNVEVAEMDYKSELYYTPNDPKLPEQYGIDQVKAKQAWDITKGAASTIISVLDTGLQMNHEEFAGRIAPGGFDHSDNDADPSDGNGHGTHCAGIAVAATDNAKGVASVCFNGRILPMKIFPNSFVSTWSAAILDATNKGARVISMSFGGAPPNQIGQDAINFAWSKNVVLFAAAGNDGQTNKNYPAAYDNVIAVAATNAQDTRADFSTYGDWVHIAAPGDNIMSTINGGTNTYAANSGTSMSCPFAASVAGLMIGKNPQITNTRVRDIIFQTCDNVGNFVSKGRINAFKAVQLVDTLVPFSSTVISAKVGTVNGSVEGTQLGTYPSVAVAGSRLTKADGLYYGVSSVKRGQLGSVASVESISKTIVPLSDIREAKVSFKGRGITGASCLIFAFNRTTSTWDQIGSKGLTNVDQTATLSMTLSTLGKYLSANGEIRFMTRAIAPVRQGSSPSFILQLDELNFVGSKRAVTP